jgi:hypothetical protein
LEEIASILLSSHRDQRKRERERERERLRGVWGDRKREKERKRERENSDLCSFHFSLQYISIGG